MWISLVSLALAVFVVFFCIAVYNKLVSRRNEVGNAFAQIDVQLRRRHDLIPNLVEVAKKYMEHERATLEAVMAARNGAAKSADLAKSMGAQQAQAAGQVGASEAVLSGALGRLMMVAEAYPDLKADANMRQLSEELTSTENVIGFARQAYNDIVYDYNVLREQFPNSLIAGAFSFARIEQLVSIDDAEQRAMVPVKF